MRVEVFEPMVLIFPEGTQRLEPGHPVELAAHRVWQLLVKRGGLVKVFDPLPPDGPRCDHGVG